MLAGDCSSTISKYENIRIILCHFHRIFFLRRHWNTQLKLLAGATISSQAPGSGPGALSSEAAWAAKKMPRLEHTDGKKKVSTQTQKSSISLTQRG